MEVEYNRLREVYESREEIQGEEICMGVTSVLECHVFGNEK
jgi:hypothetical protein